MASTGAILYIKPRSAVTVAAGRTTGALLYLSVRFLSGLYSTSGVNASANLRNLKSWLPHISVPLVDGNGRMTQQWWNFFNFLANTKVGGPEAPNVPDIVTTVETTQTQAATVAATVTGVVQQASQNAESLAATVQVAQDAGLSGASQIPPVQRTSFLEP